MKTESIWTEWPEIKIPGKLFLCFFYFSLLAVGQVWGQTNGDYRTRAAGNWNSINTWSIYDGGWRNAVAGDGYPGQLTNAGEVTIQNNQNVTLNVSPANSIGTLIILTGNNATTLTFNAAWILNVIGDINISSSSNNVAKSIALNAGTLSCSNLNLTSSGGAGGGANNRDAFIVLTTGIINVSGDITMNSTGLRTYLRFNGGGTVNIGGTMTGGNITSANNGGTTAPTAGTVNYNGPGAQNIGDYTYYNLTTSNAGVKTLTGAITINNNLAIEGNTTLATSTFNITGNAAGTMTMMPGTFLTLGNTGSGTEVSFPSAYTNGNISLDNTSTVIYQSNGNQAVSGVPDYGNLIITTGGTKTLGANTTINGDLLINGGTFATGANGVALSGNFTNNATFNGGTGTVTFNGSNAAVIGGTSGTSFYNLTINKGAAATTVTNASSAFSVANNLLITQGNLVLQATNSDYLVTNNLTVSAVATLTHSVNWNTDSRLLRIGGNLDIQGSYDYSDVPRAHIQMNGAGARTIITGTTALSILTLQNGNFSANGTVTINDNFWPMFGTAGSFRTNGQIVTANAAVLINGGTVNIDGGTLNVIGGLLVGVGGLNGAVTMSAGTLNTDNINLGDGTRTGTFSQTGGITNVTGNLLINPSCSYTFSNAPAVNITGNFTNNGTYISAGESVTFNGSASQTIGGSSATGFYNLVFNNASGFAGSANISATNTLTMTSGNIDMGSNTLSLTSTNVASLIHTSGTIIGKFQRGVPAASASAFVFPVGTSSNNNAATIVRTSGTGNGTITIEYLPANPGASGIPVLDGATEVSDIFTDGYWNMSTSFASGNFDLDLDGTGMSSFTIRPRTRILQRTDNLSDWSAPGTHTNGSPPVVSRTALASSDLNGEFGLGNVDARIWYVFQDGNWADASTWTLDASTAPLFNNPGNEIPGNNDQVIIRSGRTVTVQPGTNNISISSIEIRGNLFLTTSTGHNFQVISGNGQIQIDGNSGVENFPAGDMSATNGFADADNGGTLVIGGTGNLSLNADRIFKNVMINRTNNTDLTILAANYTILGDFTVRNGLFQFGDGTTAARNLTVEGNVLVENDGSTRIGSMTTANANATHTFVMNGNFTNNGQSFFTNRTDFPNTTARYNPGNAYYTSDDNTGRVEVSFTSGTKDQVVNCNDLTYFSRLVINKGVDATYTLFLQATDSVNFRLLGRANYDSNADHTLSTQNLNAFSLISGTVKLDNNVIIPVLNTTGNYSIPSASRLWIDGGYVRKSTGTAIVPYGLIQIQEGTLIADVNSGITTRQNGSLKVDGGFVRLNQFRTSVDGVSAQGTYEQNGGVVLIRAGSINTDYAQFSLTYSGTAFIMTGGTLTIQGRSGLGPSNTRGSVFINSDPGNQNVTGGTVIFESNTTTEYRVTSRAPFYSVIMRAGISGAGNIVLSGTTSGTGAGTETLAAQPLKVLNDLIINGYDDTRYNNPLGDFPAIFSPVTSDVNVNDVYLGGSFHIGRYSDYIPVFGGVPDFDAIGNQPTHANTTWFNQSSGTSTIDTLYFGQNGLNGNTAELGNIVLDRIAGSTLRTVARTGTNGAIRFDVNGNAIIQSGILDQNAHTFRIWGSITNFGRLGTYFSSGSYPTPTGTPSTAQIRFREDANLTITTGENAVFGNIRFNAGAATTVVFDSDVYIERMEYLNGRLYIKNHTLTIDEIWNINNGGGTYFNNDVANSSVIQVNNSGIVANILVFTDGKASDGGLRLRISGNTTAESATTRVDNTSPITFPIGFTPDGGTTFYSRPAQVKIKNFADDGYIRINVVSGQLQTTDLSGGELLEHYWRVRHDGFTTVPQVAFRFYYRSADNGSGVDLPAESTQEASYVPGYVLDNSPFIRYYESDPAQDLDDLVTSPFQAQTRYITFNGTSTGGDFEQASFNGLSLINANFTAGQATRFIGAPRIFYSRLDDFGTDWNSGATWNSEAELLANPPATDNHDPNVPQFGGNVVGVTFPGPGDIAVLGVNPILGRPQSVRLNSNITYSAAEFRFDINVPITQPGRGGFSFLPEFIINTNTPVLNIGRIIGTGVITDRENRDISFAGIDIGDYVNQSESYYLIENFQNGPANYVNLPPRLPNVIITSDAFGDANRITRITTDLETTGDLNIVGGAKLRLASSGATPDQGDLVVRGNLRLIKGFNPFPSGPQMGDGGTSHPELQFEGSSGGAVPGRSVEVYGDILLENRNSAQPRIFIINPGANIASHSLTVKGNIADDSNLNGGIDLFVNTDRTTLFIKGDQNAQLSRTNPTASSIPRFFQIVMHKDNPDSSFTINTNFRIANATSAFQPLDILIGTLILNGMANPAEPTPGLLLASGSNFFLPNIQNPLASSGSGGLEIRQGTVRIEGNNTGMILDGKLTVSGGTLNMATGVGNGNNFIEYSASGKAEIEVTGGVMTIGSHLRRSTTSTSGVLKYSQTGGQVTIGRFAAPTTSRGLFEVMNAGSSFTLDIDPLAGHAFTIVRHVNSTTVPTLRVSPQTVSIGNNSIITIGSGDTPANQNNVGILADVPLSRVAIASSNITGAKLYSVPLEVNELSITNGATFNANGFNVTINQELANDGTFITSGTSVNNQNTIFPSNGASSIIGTGTTNFWNFTKQGNGTLTLGNEITVNNNAFIFDGVMSTASSAMNLKKDLLHDATHTSDPAGPGIIFNGAQKQNLDRSGPGTSIFGVVELNNLSGLVIADTEENFQFDHRLILNTGVIDIGGNLVIFPVGAEIANKAGGTGVNDFNINRMIQTNSSIRDFGVRKFFPTTTAGNISFTYPVGLLGYTPVVISATDISAGHITVRPVADIPPIAEDTENNPPVCNDPDIVDADNVLRYYWILKSDGINGFNGEANMYYNPDDVYVTAPYTVANFGPARLFNQSDTWDKVFTEIDFDEISQRITYPFNNSDDSTVEGIYTAGVTLQNDGTTLLCGAAIPDQVPQFITLETPASGNVYVDGSYQGGIAPDAGNSFDLVVKSGFSLVYDVNNIRTRKITIEPGATLEIASGTSNHNLGFVTGEGNLKLTSNTSFVLFPTGDYDTFFPDVNCTAGGGLEYAGTGSYAVLAGIPRIRNVIFSGAGNRTFPNNHNLIICEDLEILGSVNLAIPDGGNATTVIGDIYKSDASMFDNGGGNSVIILNGTSQQHIYGSFTNNNGFNRLTVNNPGGLSIINNADASRGISSNADVDVEGLLTFSNGLIYTNDNNTLRLRQSGSMSGFGNARYVNGPFVRELSNFTQVFDFPVGDGARYGFITIEDPFGGLSPKDWTVRYVNNTPPFVYTLSAAAHAAGVEKTSSNEYWVINTNSTGSPTSKVGPRWTTASDVVDVIGNLRVLYLDADTGTEWDLLATVSAPSGTPDAGFMTAGPLSYSTKYVTFGTLDEDITPLPVELVSFSGKEQDGQVLLKWETASELNNDYFRIEHSVDGRNFNAIGEVAGAGTVHTTQLYQFIHRNPLFPNNYYRLKQVDFDGAFEYSEIILVRLNQQYVKDQIDFTVYPNPASGGSVNIMLRTIDYTSIMTIEVVNLNGVLIYQKMIDVMDLETSFELNLGNSISRGIYLIRLSQSGNSSVQKLILK